MKKTKEEYRLYILMRNDLPSMNAGKAMAQAAHAANAFTAEWGHLDDVKAWCNRKHQFGTTIVLAVNKDTLVHTLKRAAMRMDFPPPFGPVWDETYPFITTPEIAQLIPKSKLTAPMIWNSCDRVVLFRKEITCGYVFVLNGSSDQKELVGDLPLHP
jgi:hypothetical protein